MLDMFQSKVLIFQEGQNNKSTGQPSTNNENKKKLKINQLVIDKSL